MSVDTCIENLPNIHQPHQLTSVKVTAAIYFFNGNEWNAALNSYKCNVIATIIAKIDVQTPVVMFYFWFKYHSQLLWIKFQFSYNELCCRHLAFSQ